MKEKHKQTNKQTNNQKNKYKQTQTNQHKQTSTNTNQDQPGINDPHLPPITQRFHLKHWQHHFMLDKAT